MPIGGPSWRPIARAVSALSCFAAGGRDCPDRGVVSVLLFVDGHAHKCDARAVRRHLWIADPNEVEEIFFSDTAFLRQCRRGQRYNDEQKNGDTKAHIRSFQVMRIDAD